MPLNPESLTIDRRSPVPLYFQIERLIEREIGSGRFLPNERLPTEPELADSFGVSRSVIRQALARLERVGVIARERGRGTFVATTRPHSWQVQSSEGFFENEVGRLGRSVSSRVLRALIEPLPVWAAELLSVPKGTAGVTLERVRFVDGMLTLYDLNHLPEQYAAAVLALSDAPSGSLYDVLRAQYGVTVEGGHRIIDAVLADEVLGRLLEVDTGAPLLLVEGVDIDSNNRIFDCYRTWVRQDRLKLEVQVAQGMRSRPGPRGDLHANDVPSRGTLRANAERGGAAWVHQER
jgi:GntR family transcriptional regulator